ncbi:DUF4942 domain-containing protein [Shigella sonnei]|uniref:DUF4942 domain-containing protein n=1 Tax=Shigella sonnei TaxID=624 RepID=UPI0006637DC2|nr:Uncharacterised protein [Shigella sonnei]
MNAIIPHKRRDGRSSFEDLIAYTSVRDDVQENELTEDSEIKSDVPHRNRFRRLVDYATRLRNEKFVSLIDVYRKLSWDYRTNNPCRLGKKIIIENLLYRWSNGRVTLDCSGREALDDLVRPFYLLEGRNVPDFRNSIGAQYGEFLGNGDNVGKLLEGEYFTVRGYQKGTVHIVFKRSDLVEKLNDIIARHYPGALPPRV